MKKTILVYCFFILVLAAAIYLYNFWSGLVVGSYLSAIIFVKAGRKHAGKAAEEVDEIIRKRLSQ